MGGTLGGGHGRGHSRRSLLRAAGGTAALTSMSGVLAGCGLLDDDRPSPGTPDPLEPLLAQTREMVARYDAAIAAQPGLAARLAPLRDATAQHAAAVAGLLGADPSASPTTAASATAAATAPATSPVTVLADLGAAEKAGQRAATDLCLTAAAERAPLLGSIVAARAIHQAVLS